MTHTPAHSHASGHDRPGHGPAPEHDTGLVELLDLDAVLGAPVLSAAIDAASDALGSEPRTIVDLGAGTGTGSLALAARFAHARIHSLDASSAMLDRLRRAAATVGVADRVEPHLVDLDGDWPAVLPGSIDRGSVDCGSIDRGSIDRGRVDLGSVDCGCVDLVWAALSLHHVTNPERVLQQVMQVLRPGGVLVVMEMTGTTTFDPDDLGTGNDKLGDRVVAALAARGYPVTAEWTAELTEAGFTAVQRFDTDLTASALTAEGAHYLELNLSRNRGRLEGGEDAESHGHEHHGADGHSADDYSADGHSADGHSADGHSADGHSADDYGSDGHSADGHGADDYSTADFDARGFSAGGLGAGGLSADDVTALDAAIADLNAGTSTLKFASGRAVWVAVRP